MAKDQQPMGSELERRQRGTVDVHRLVVHGDIKLKQMSWI